MSWEEYKLSPVWSDSESVCYERAYDRPSGGCSVLQITKTEGEVSVVFVRHFRVRQLQDRPVKSVISTRRLSPQGARRMLALMD